MTRHAISNTLIFLCCLSVIGFVGWRAGAEATEQRLAAEPSAVALVDIERALNSLNELTDKNADLATRVESRQKDLDALRKRIEGLQEEEKLLPENAPDDQRRNLRAQIFELRETAKARTNAYQSLINIEKGEIIKPLYEKLVKSIGEVAAKEGYDLVVFDNRSLKVPTDVQAVINDVIQQKSILYASNQLDITDQVIALMNNKYSTGVN